MSRLSGTESSFERAKAVVKDLVETFKANEHRYLSSTYQEAEARKDFIDKFFIALGWDVNHDEQKNPYEQEVKVEPAVQAGGQRRADYAFHLTPDYRNVRFFVEAKKPFGDIATPDNYFQTIRYAWNSKTPLAVLTNFAQFHVLDCRYKPDIETALSRYVANSLWCKSRYLRAKEVRYPQESFVKSRYGDGNAQGSRAARGSVGGVYGYGCWPGPPVLCWSERGS